MKFVGFESKKVAFHREITFVICLLFIQTALAQPLQVDLKVMEDERKVEVLIGGKFFTAYLFPQDLEKPVLFPLLTATGTPVTRGYPLSPRSGERVDHPHHVGMWFNFGDVNGLDFWNNSYAIPTEERQKFGRVVHRKIEKASSGNEGVLSVRCDWIDSEGKVLLQEATVFRFTGSGLLRVMDRETRLTAVRQVVFKDNKEGLLAIRMDRAFEEPVTEPEIFTDASGRPTTIASVDNTGVNGIYISSNGKAGTAVWGTRGDWVSLTAEKNGERITVAMIDHPGNFGYPAHWHARTYGLFSVNNFGSRVFVPSDPQQSLSLDDGESVVFRHRMVIGPSGELSAESMEKLMIDFRSK